MASRSIVYTFGEPLVYIDRESASSESPSTPREFSGLSESMRSLFLVSILVLSMLLPCSTKYTTETWYIERSVLDYTARTQTPYTSHRGERTTFTALISASTPYLTTEQIWTTL